MEEHFSLAKATARRINQTYAITEPWSIDIEDLAMALRVFVKEERLKDAAASLVSKNGLGVISIDSQITSTARRRFAIAHELGHFLLHSNRIPSFICTDEMFLQWYHGCEREPEANSFAAELLMPPDLFRSYTSKRPLEKSILELCANQFLTSLTATCLRYIEVGHYPCILFCTKDGNIKWYKKSPHFRFKPMYHVGDRVSDLSCAGDYFDNGVFESDTQEVQFDAWLKTYDDVEQTFIYELPIIFENYGISLSLVWTG